MNKKLCAYLSLLVLLGATFCTPAIAVAEMVSNIEVESQTSQSNSPATDTKRKNQQQLQKTRRVLVKQSKIPQTVNRKSDHYYYD